VSFGRITTAAVVTASVQYKQTAEHQGTKTVPDNYIGAFKGKLRDQT